MQSIGAIALDPKNPKNVWVGTGEPWTRNSVSIGDGIYKSTDGGETWTHVGSAELRNGSRKIAVSPNNSDTVYAAVPGALWSDSPDRGLYKTTDGGKTWNLILKGANLSTGCSTIAIDPTNPDIMFAGMWDFRRKGWTFRSGGEGRTNPRRAACSARLMAARPGRKLPRKPQGFSEETVRPNRGRDCAVECEAGLRFRRIARQRALRFRRWRATWDQRDKSKWMVWRPFYFANLIVDPKNPDRVFKTDGALILSEDAGKSFATVGGFNGAHGDVHDVWIDPTNPQNVIPGTMAGFGIPTMAATNGGKRTTCRSRSSITSAWTMPIRIGSTAVCRTTVPGSASRNSRRDR